MRLCCLFGGLAELDPGVVDERAQPFEVCWIVKVAGHADASGGVDEDVLACDTEGGHLVPEVLLVLDCNAVVIHTKLKCLGFRAALASDEQGHQRCQADDSKDRGCRRGGWCGHLVEEGATALPEEEQQGGTHDQTCGTADCEHPLPPGCRLDRPEPLHTKVDAVLVLCCIKGQRQVHLLRIAGYPVGMHDLLAAYARDGFAVVRGVVDTSEVHELRLAFDRLIARARGLDATGEVDGAQFVVDADPFRLHRVVWCGGADPVLARFGSDPRVLAIASAILKAKTLVQLIQQAHFKLPGDDVGFSWHQDASNRRYGSDLWTDVDGAGSFVQMALAVDPMRADNGPLRVIPGSHRLGFVADPISGAIPPEHLDLDAAVDVLLEPGDMAVFGPFLLHGSPPNRSDAPRRLFLQGYTLPGANRRVYPGCGLGVERVCLDAVASLGLGSN